MASGLIGAKPLPGPFDIVWIGPKDEKINDILIEIHTFYLKKMHWKVSSTK